MTAVKKWVAAGSSAAVLTGGLFLAAPAAHADTCAAPARGGEVSNLVTAADDLHDTGVHFNSLVTDPGTLAAIEAAQVDLQNAIVTSDTIGPAQDAWNRILVLQESYALNTDDAAVDAAWASSAAAAADFRAAAEVAAAGNTVNMEQGADLIALFQDNCGALLTGTGIGGTGTGDWSDSDDWSGAGTGADTGSGVNQGINMQTAGEGGLGTGVLAGLLAAGAAVSGAVAFRLRRRNA